MLLSHFHALIGADIDAFAAGLDHIAVPLRACWRAVSFRRVDLPDDRAQLRVDFYRLCDADVYPAVRQAELAVFRRACALRIVCVLRPALL